MRVAVAFVFLLSLGSVASADGFSGAGYLPVQTTADQSAAPAGRSWSVGTGIISVPSGNQLDAVISNPAGSGCATAVFTLRRYTNPTNSMLQFQSFSNPTAITTNAATVGNRLVGGSPATGMTFGYAARAAGAMGGTAGVSAPLLANFEEDITVTLVLPQGKTYGVSLTGQQGGVLQAAANLSLTFVGYCL